MVNRMLGLAATITGMTFSKSITPLRAPVLPRYSTFIELRLLLSGNDSLRASRYSHRMAFGTTSSVLSDKKRLQNFFQSGDNTNTLSARLSVHLIILRSTLEHPS